MSQKKKVILLVDVIQTSLGGAERQILELCKNIDQSQFELIVVCLSKYSHLLHEIRKFGVKTQRLNIHRIYSPSAIYQGFQFSQYLKREGVQILMTYHFGSDLWGTIFGKLAGVPM